MSKCENKKCKADQICNPKTGRCVKRTGAIGKKLLAKSKSRSKSVKKSRSRRSKSVKKSKSRRSKSVKKRRSVKKSKAPKKSQKCVTIQMRRGKAIYHIKIPAAWNISKLSPLRQGSYAIAYKCKIDNNQAVILCRPLDTFLETEDCLESEERTWRDCIPLTHEDYLKELKSTKIAASILGNLCPKFYYSRVCDGHTNAHRRFQATQFGIEVWEYFEYDVKTLLRKGKVKGKFLNKLKLWAKELCAKLEEENMYYSDLHSGNILVSKSLDRFAIADLGSIEINATRTGCNWYLINKDF